jgi:nitrite reductase/ring-hydroxylating ferredoxin subunit
MSILGALCKFCHSSVRQGSFDEQSRCSGRCILSRNDRTGTLHFDTIYCIFPLDRSLQFPVVIIAAQRTTSSRAARNAYTMAAFVDVARLDQIPVGVGSVFTIAENRVALFLVDGFVFAVDDSCIRCGSSLAAGNLYRTRVTCGCGWQYDVATGCLNGIPALRIDTFEVRVLDSHVMVANICKTWSPPAK